MKILFLINHDIASFYALKLLLPRLTHHSIWVWRSSAVGTTSKHDIPLPLERLKVYEQASLTDSPIDLDSLSLIERATKIDTNFINRYLQASSIIENNINDQAALKEIESLGIELIISIRYGKILKSDVIKLPKHGVINLHSGILPNYRGVMATFWSMLNGELEIGTTLHYIDDTSIDTGPIIKISKQPINKRNCYLSNVVALYQVGCYDILDVVKDLEFGADVRYELPVGEGNYYTFPTHDDTLQFTSKGNRMVDDVWFKRFVQQF